MDENIHIVMAIHDKDGTYIYSMAATIMSIMMNTDRKCCFHLMVDDTLNKQNMDILSTMITEKKHTCIFYNVSENFLKYDFITKRFSIATLYRLAIPEVLGNIDKALYLDSDIICNLDIYKLWNIDISKHYLGAVPDATANNSKIKYKFNIEILTGRNYDKYFNTGVLVFNIKKIRGDKIDVMKLGLKYLDDFPTTDFCDQDALNYIFDDNYLELSRTYNMIVQSFEYIEGNEYIFHYAGTIKPWHEYQSNKDIYYWKYRMQTPFWQKNIDKNIKSLIELPRDLSSIIDKWPLYKSREFKHKFLLRAKKHYGRKWFNKC